jgi:hypothetical protein
MSAAVSIDFGNSFTKVALRAQPDAASEMAKDQSLTLDEYNFCIPTLAACKRGKGREQWDFGTNVLRHKESAAGLTVYRNWKPLFFRGEQSGPGTDCECQASTPATMHASDKYHGLSDEQWLQVKQILNLREENRGAIEKAIPPADAAPTTTAFPLDADEETDIDAKQVGIGFFRWLREFIEPICRARGIGALASIPARISLPSFGSMTKATLLLAEILEEAGWCPAERNGMLPEPYSNAIGIFTEGQNAVHSPGRAGVMPYYPKMFKDTGLLRAMLDAIDKQGPKVAWTLIVDVGGYTADFSMMGLDLEDLGAPIKGMLAGKRRLAYGSTAIGVTNLDQRVTLLLGEMEREAFQKILRDPDQGRLESFHTRIYSDGSPYRLKNITIGQGDQAEQIRECVSAFAEEIADNAVKFMDRYQYGHIDDLILTGGGCMVPVVRDELKLRLGEYGVRKTHMYVPPTDSLVRKDCHSLPARLVRGATAIGGASVYFDYAD